MTVVFQLPEDMAQLLSARARSCGMGLPEYLQALLQREALSGDWISLREAQAITGLQRLRLREAIGRGELEAQKSGRLWRVRRHELERWSHARGGQAPEPSAPQVPQPGRVPPQAEEHHTSSGEHGEGARSEGSQSWREVPSQTPKPAGSGGAAVL